MIRCSAMVSNVLIINSKINKILINQVGTQ
jgi:hypothetical protein